MTNYTDEVPEHRSPETWNEASKWAAAFCQHNPHTGVEEVTMTRWFANCIERTRATKGEDDG